MLDEGGRQVEELRRTGAVERRWELETVAREPLSDLDLEHVDVIHVIRASAEREDLDEEVEKYDQDRVDHDFRRLLILHALPELAPSAVRRLIYSRLSPGIVNEHVTSNPQRRRDV